MACFGCGVRTLGFDGAALPFSEPGVGSKYAPDRPVKIDHLHLELSLFPDTRRWSGSASFQVTTRPGYAGTVQFDFADGFIDEVTDGLGKPLAWHHDEAVLTVHTDEPIVIKVRFHGENPTRGLYFTGPAPWAPGRQEMAWTQCQDEDAHFVFPCHDDPGTKHPWTVRLDGPVGTTLLSNGRQVSESVEGDRSVAVYEQAEPMPAYLFTAVCGRFSTVATTWRDRSVRYLVPVGEEEAVERSMGRTPEMIELFSTLTGVAYPWPRYDQVVVHEFIFGGMENTGCTTMTDLLLVDEKAALEYDPEGLVSHELAHQWFGDLVTCQDWSQAWLNESWATYMESVWAEHSRPVADVTWHRFETALEYLEEDGGRYRRPIVSYGYREPIDVFDRHLYQKGGNVLHTLRVELGDAGFWAGVNRYLSDNAHQTVHSRHFQRAMEQATGRNLDRFFEQWIFGSGHPALEVKLAQADGALSVEVKQTQAHEGTAQAFQFGLRVEGESAGGERFGVTLRVSERQQLFFVPVAGEITAVRVDPGFRVLATVSVEAPQPWLVKMLGDSCPVVATRAAKSLFKDGSRKALLALRDALLHQGFWAVRAQVAEGFGKRGGAEAKGWLLEALAAETHPKARRAMVTSLSGFRDAEVATAMLGLLGGELPTWHLQGAALQTLGETRDPRGLPVLRAQIEVPSWAHTVAGKALTGLAAHESEGVLTDLIAASQPEKPDRVRAAAAQALGRLADKVPAARTAAVERLGAMLSEPGFRCHLIACQALGQARDRSGEAALVRAHQSAPDGRIRRAAYEALAVLRQGRTSEEGLASLRARLDLLTEENRSLRARLEKVEAKLEK